MRKRFFSILTALALCLTLLPTAALADGTAFGDVSGHWAGEAITEWHEKGYIGGYGDGTFRPDSSITRAEFVKLLNRVLGLTAEAAISFPDVKESDWFYAEVAKAAAAGYAKGGTDGAFHPDAPITRAEAAVMLSRALDLAADEGRAAQFADAAAIPAWAKGSIGAVAASGFMNGYPDGAFGAKDSITRAQAVVTLDRVQNVTVTADGTVLTDKTIAGDLIIAESVGEGEVTLKNVTVEGSLIIRGGGANSVYLDGVTVRGEVRLEKDGLHLRLQGGTKLGTVQVLARVKLSGSGTIELLLVSADGVTVDRTLTVGKTETDSGVKAPTVYNPDSSGSSSSGGGTTPAPTPKIEITQMLAPTVGIEVAYGTSEDEAMKSLPSEVGLETKNGTVFANVTWVRKGGETYDPNPTTAATVTYVSTVTIPDGYSYQGATSIETTIKVLANGVAVAKKKLTGTLSVSPVYIVSYIDPNGAEIKEKLPTEIHLHCADASWVKGSMASSNDWSVRILGGPVENGYQSLSASCNSDRITLPNGYEFESGISSVSFTFYMKQRDNTKLQAALDAAKKQMDRTTNSQAVALSTGKIYVLPDDEDEGTVSQGVRYVKQEVIKALQNLTGNTWDADNYDPTASQAAVNALAEKITTETETLKTALQAFKTGQTYTNENILASVRERLEIIGSNYAYDKDKQPLTVEKYVTVGSASGLALPWEVTGVKIDADGTPAAVKLVWSMESTAYAELRKDSGEGRQYVWLTETNTEPRNLSLLVYAIGYTDPVTNQYVNFNKTNSSEGVQVEAYNNLIVGAPIARDPNHSVVETPELTSGQENTFTVRIPLPYNTPKIKTIDATKITASCTDGSLTGNITVTEAKADTVNTSDVCTYLSVTLRARTKQLAAVVASDNPVDGIHYQTATVTLHIPYDAITLTEWAKENGWYIPQDGIELAGDVKIRYPLVRSNSQLLKAAM